MFKKFPALSKIVLNVPKCFKAIQIEPKLSRMVQTLSNMVQNGPKWFKWLKIDFFFITQMVDHGPTLPTTVGNCQNSF